MTADAKKQIDAFGATIKHYFDTQNNSAIHALTLDVDIANRFIDIKVYKPTLGLVAAIPGTGMKTAFTAAPVLSVTAQNGSHAELIVAGEDGKPVRNVLSAALYIADAMEKQFGINAMNDTLADILALPEQTRTMRFLFGCKDGDPNPAVGTLPEYMADYTLKFRAAPLLLVQDDFIVSGLTKTVQLALQNAPADAALTWTSASDAVATVDSNGLVTAVGGGTTTITVTDATSGETAQARIVVLADTFTLGYSPSELESLTYTGSSALGYSADVELPAEGDENALYVKLPDTDMPISLRLINPTGTYQFDSSVTLRNALIKFPSNFIRADYTKENNYVLIMQIGNVIYNVRFPNSKGVVSSAPVTDPKSLVGTYASGDNIWMFRESDGAVSSLLQGDSHWAAVSISSGLVTLDGACNELSRAIQTGYNANVYFSYTPATKELEITKIQGTLSSTVAVGNVFMPSDRVADVTTCMLGYLQNKYLPTTFTLCTNDTINGVCVSAKHFTLCDSATPDTCADLLHVTPCPAPAGAGTLCGAIRGHGLDCSKPWNHAAP